MKTQQWSIKHPDLARVLKDKLENKESCSDLIDSYAELMDSMCRFLSRLIGGAGMKAVLTRSIQVAARDVPLLKKIRVDEKEVYFDEFRDQVSKVGCGTAEVFDAFLGLSAMLFETLTDLAGDALTEPLVRHLDQKR